MRRRQDNNKAWRGVAGVVALAAALVWALVWVSGQRDEATETVVDIPVAEQPPPPADIPAENSAPSPSADAPGAKPAPTPSADAPPTAPAPTPSADGTAADTRPPPHATPETVERMQQALQQIKSASMPPSEAAIDGKRERLLVTRRPGMAAMQGGPFALLAAMKEVEINHLAALDITIVEVPVGWDLEHLRKVIAEDPSVESTSRDRVVRAQGRVVPNDPNFDLQRNLDHVSDVDVDAPEAWAYTTGSEEVVVAVIDTGIDYSHVDLAPNLWVNSDETPGNNMDDDGNGYVDDIHGINVTRLDGAAVINVNDPRQGDPWDDNGHGTGVASVIGARGNNGALLTGVNWNVRIMSIKALRSDGDGVDSDIVTGINYIMLMRRTWNVNVKVVNASFGFDPGPQGCTTAATPAPMARALYRAIARLGEEDILFVTSAGNDRMDIDEPNQAQSPACYDHDHLITVASHAIRDRGIISNYGATSVDLAAPGNAIPAVGVPSSSSRRPQSRKDPVDSGIEIFSDATESTTAAEMWMTDSPWERTTEQRRSGLYSWTDSRGGPYTASQNISLTSPTVDLSASTPGDVYLFLRADIMTNLEYSGRGCSKFCDALYLEMSGGPVMNWSRREAWSDNSGGWRLMSVAIPAWGYKSDFRFRFRLATSPATNFDGVYLDNIRIISHGTGADTRSSRSGSSYAAPHVAGAAALLWAHRPGLGVREVRAALLDNVDQSPALIGNVASGGALNIAEALFSVTEPGFRIHSSRTTVMEGEAGHLAVSLTREPRGTRDQVVVRAVAADAGRVTGINPNTLTFTQANWHQPQRIDFGTLAGIFRPNPVETLRLSVDTTQSDPAWAAVSQSVAVRVDVERDLHIHASQTTVMAGASGYVDVSLTREPRGTTPNVVVRAETTTDGRVTGINPNTLTFTQANWHQPQRIDFGTLAGIFRPNPVETLRISVDATQSDPAYAAVRRSVAVQVDVDRGLYIHASQTTVMEGASGYVDVSLTREPEGTTPNVVVRVTTATAGRITGLSADTLTFTQANWHEPQRIDFGTLAGVFRPDPLETLQLSVDATRSDPAWATVRRSVAVQVDVERGIYIHASQTTVMEGATGYFNVSLTRTPQGAGRSVLLQVAASNPGRIQVNPGLLLFRNDNWHQPQTASFIVTNDEAVQPTTVTELLQFSVVAASSDPAYAAVSRSVAVRLINDDLWDVLGNDGSLTVSEGGSATVALVFNPLPQDVSMTIAPGYARDAGPDDHETPVEIHAAAGSTGTRFTIRITDDEANETTETISFQISPSSPDVLGTRTILVVVTIPANDLPTATLEVSPALLAEGSSAVVTVRLDIPVARAVAFTVNAEPDTARYSLSSDTLFILQATTHGSVTLSAPDNGVREESQIVTLTFQQTPGSPAPVLRGDPSTAQLRIYDELPLLLRLRVFLEGAISTDGRTTTAPDTP